jgi:hypothetical protein
MPRKRDPNRKPAARPRPWSAEDVTRLFEMIEIEGVSFPDCDKHFSRGKNACATKYYSERSRRFAGPREENERIAPLLAERDERDRLRLQQSPIAALMGDPLPGCSALDERMKKL